MWDETIIGDVRRFFETRDEQFHKIRPEKACICTPRIQRLTFLKLSRCQKTFSTWLYYMSYLILLWIEKSRRNLKSLSQNQQHANNMRKLWRSAQNRRENHLLIVKNWEGNSSPVEFSPAAFRLRKFIKQRERSWKMSVFSCLLTSLETNKYQKFRNISFVWNEWENFKVRKRRMFDKSFKSCILWICEKFWK